MTNPLTREDVDELKIRDGIGWKRDPDKVGWLISAGIVDYVAAIERLRAALASQSLSREAEKWQPIETAPKDGAHVLLFSPDAVEPQVFLGYWFNEEHGWFDSWKDIAPEIDADPTHWQPLPEPPDALAQHPAKESPKREAEIRREVIEECAKVAEWVDHGQSHPRAKDANDKIATALRALAQQPDKTN